MMHKLILIAHIFLFSTNLFALDVPPKSKRLVNDYAGLISSTQETQLEQKLVSYYDSTSVQLAVVIISSLEGDDLFEFSQKLASEWGIGTAKTSNGILLLISVEDKKIRIHTGYGTEGAVTDALAKRIIENEIKPAFKSGDFFAGIDAGTNAIAAALKGEYTAEDKAPAGKKLPFGGIIIVLVIIIYLISRMAGSGRGYSSHGRSTFGAPWIGGFGGGGGGFGGSSGGGFGGFGGGGFGGGGASGGW